MRLITFNYYSVVVKAPKSAQKIVHRVQKVTEEKSLVTIFVCFCFCQCMQSGGLIFFFSFPNSAIDHSDKHLNNYKPCTARWSVDRIFAFQPKGSVFKPVSMRQLFLQAVLYSWDQQKPRLLMNDPEYVYWDVYWEYFKLGMPLVF